MIIPFLLASIVAAQPDAPRVPSPDTFATAPLDDGSLGQATAREDLQQIATAQQTARVSNNSISGPSVTGNVAIDGNAFQNLQGLAVISANSGNNVAINSSLNVNIHFSPMP
jgi:hypothetical protein